MVLLTPSAVSAVLSGGIICIFTFLLFLSGYVLQQQTVRSLQDALRNPPEKVSVPKLVLPPQFQVGDESGAVGSSGAAQMVLNANTASVESENATGEPSGRDLWYGYIQYSTGKNLLNLEDVDPGSSVPDSANQEAEAGDETGAGDQTTRTSGVTISQESLAYIFSLSNFNSLCSAVLFAKQHRTSTQIVPQPHIIFIYPATWELHNDKEHIAAMDLLRETQDTLRVTLHPVSISRVWAGISVEQQLLAELQRYRWPYHRAMYLDSPGMAIDLPTLDRALVQSNTKAAWTLLHSDPKSYEASHPPLLLWAAGRGLLYPRVDMKYLTTHVGSSSTAQRHINSVATKAEADLTAYVMFSEKELEARNGRGRAADGIFERFERDRRGACLGTGLMG